MLILFLQFFVEPLLLRRFDRTFFTVKQFHTSKKTFHAIFTLLFILHNIGNYCTATVECNGDTAAEYLGNAKVMYRLTVMEFTDLNRNNIENNAKSASKYKNGSQQATAQVNYLVCGEITLYSCPTSA